VDMTFTAEQKDYVQMRFMPMEEGEKKDG